VAEADGTESVEAFLRSLGATEAQIDEVRGERRFASLAGDLVLARGATLSAEDLADRAGVDVAEVLSVWRALGIVVPDGRQAMFSERDADLTAYLIRSNPIGEHGDELLRVLGTSLARVAEASVSLYVQTVEMHMDAAADDLMAWTKDLADVTTAALRLGLPDRESR
jgi:predicted RecB family endonuclease